jgi:hypothetical protein
MTAAKKEKRTSSSPKCGNKEAMILITAAQK